MNKRLMHTLLIGLFHVALVISNHSRARGSSAWSRNAYEHPQCVMLMKLQKSDGWQLHCAFDKQHGGTVGPCHTHLAVLVALNL